MFSLLNSNLLATRFTTFTLNEVKIDSFEFEVTDGYNLVFCTFRVTITDVDNKKPILTVGDLVVEEGETRLMTPFEMTVEDGDIYA